MKTFYFLLLILAGMGLGAQSTAEDEIVRFQEELHKEFTDSTRSPLPKADIATFPGHDFYRIDLSYRVSAKLLRTPNEKPFKMGTTSGELQDYVKYGELSFMLKGKAYKLNVYQNVAMSKLPAYKDYLFLPFTDLTNLDETYGGGRYIDLSIPKGNTITVDFNQAYNPYCIYNDKYSCPIPPKENHLETEVKAGVKKPAGN